MNKPTSIPAFLAALSIIASAIGGSIFANWFMGNDVTQDARLKQLDTISSQLTTIGERVRILSDSDKTYWNGYSEGLTACYTSHP